MSKFREDIRQFRLRSRDKTPNELFYKIYWPMNDVTFSTRYYLNPSNINPIPDSAVSVFFQDPGGRIESLEP